MRKELQRDEGLLRLSRGTRWLAAGAVAGAGLMSIAVAESLPGRSSAATTPRTTPAPSTSASTASGASEEQSQPSEGDDDSGAAAPQTVPSTAPPTFTVPTAPPQTAYNPPVVSSGGS